MPTGREIILTEISLQENSDRQIELIHAAARGAELGPPRAGHGVHPHDTVVVPVRHVDLPGANKDAARRVKLVRAAAGWRSAQRRPPRAGHGVHPHDAVVARIRHVDLPGAADDADTSVAMVDPAAAGSSAERAPPG